MLDTPHFIQTNEQPTAVIHPTVSCAEISHVMDPAIAEVMAAIASKEADLVGPCFTYHMKRPSDLFDFEVGFPVNGPINHPRRSREDGKIAGRKNRPHDL